MGKFPAGSMVAGVWTGLGFSNWINFRTRIQKFWDRSGVRKSDSGHLWYLPCPLLSSRDRRTRLGVWGGGRPPGLENFQGNSVFQGKRKLLKNP